MSIQPALKQACASAIAVITHGLTPPILVEDFLANPTVTKLIGSKTVCPQAIAQTPLTDRWLMDWLMSTKNTPLLVAVFRLGHLQAIGQKEQGEQGEKNSSTSPAMNAFFATLENNHAFATAPPTAASTAATKDTTTLAMLVHVAEVTAKETAAATAVATAAATVSHQHQMEQIRTTFAMEETKLNNTVLRLQQQVQLHTEEKQHNDWEYHNNSKTKQQLKELQIENETLRAHMQLMSQCDVDKTLRELHHETDLLSHRLSRQKKKIMQPVQSLKEDNTRLYESFQTQRRRSVVAVGRVAELELALNGRDTVVR